MKELQSLIDFAYYSPALSNAAGTSKWTSGDAFIGVQSDLYWSSTTSSGSTPDAFYMDLANSVTGYTSKTDKLYVWPVRAGR